MSCSGNVDPHYADRAAIDAVDHNTERGEVANRRIVHRKPPFGSRMGDHERDFIEAIDHYANL